MQDERADLVQRLRQQSDRRADLLTRRDELVRQNQELSDRGLSRDPEGADISRRT